MFVLLIDAIIEQLSRKLKEVTKYLSISVWDGGLWILTFLATVLVDVDLGLIIGVSLSIAIVIIRSVVPDVTVLGRDDKTKVWLDKEKYDVEESDTRFVILQVIL